MQKITTYLWFDSQAKEAAEFYCSVFNNSRILSASPMMVVFELEGQRFMALNGGPKFKFTEAISLYVDCQTQEEVDSLWNKLTSGGGSESMCGWLKDKYGLSWQIIPNQLIKLISDKDPAKAQRAMQAMLKMRKIDIRGLEEAVNR
ncbi:MAG: VOC family protein [Cyclobacteriaceae bacterium]|nr:VOC family protein [Cyclobacteriaceae bacterium]